MDRDHAADAVVELLTSTDAHLDLLGSTDPLPRPVDISLRAWGVWLHDGGRPGSTSYVGPLAPPRVSACGDALKVLTPRDPARRGADHEIDRAGLTELAQRAAKGNERRCVALWVGSMMWGSGTLNGRGPWRTAEGLADPDLGALLTASHKALRNGDLSGAYELASEIPGSGESAFTKWLWAASLGLPDVTPRPLVLDTNVRSTLGLADVRPQHNASGYVDYVEIAALAADRLRAAGHPGASPEMVEHLLSLGGP